MDGVWYACSQTCRSKKAPNKLNGARSHLGILLGGCSSPTGTGTSKLSPPKPRKSTTATTCRNDVADTACNRERCVNIVRSTLQIDMGAQVLGTAVPIDVAVGATMQAPLAITVAAVVSEIFLASCTGFIADLAECIAIVCFKSGTSAWSWSPA